MCPQVFSPMSSKRLCLDCWTTFRELPQGAKKMTREFLLSVPGNDKDGRLFTTSEVSSFMFLEINPVHGNVLRV